MLGKYTGHGLRQMAGDPKPARTGKTREAHDTPDHQVSEADVRIYAALITGGLAFAGVLVGILWQWSLNRRTTRQIRDLEAFKAGLARERDTAAAADAKELAREEARLTERANVEQARRDYAHRGRVRLYEEYEPIAFRMVEAAINAAWRVQSLARSAKKGDIREDGSGWLAGRGYYLLVTVYDLLAPAATFRLLRGRLNSVDFSLDRRIGWEYRLCKQAFISFTDDFKLANEIAPPLVYAPNDPEWQTLRADNPSTYWRQGLAVGRLEALLDAMTDDTSGRILTYGEFENRYLADPGGDLATQLDFALDVVEEFHPATRPVLWRILLYQVVLYHNLTLSALHHSETDAEAAGTVRELPASIIDKYVTDKLNQEATARLAAQLSAQARADLEGAMAI